MEEDPKKQPGYFIVDNDYIDSGCHAALCRYSMPAAVILPILKRYKNQKTGWAYPSIKQLVIDSGFVKDTVCKATAILAEFHLIEKKQAGKRFHFRMQYRIVNHDRIGYEKIARIIPIRSEQSKAKSVIPTASEQSKKQKKDETIRTIPTASEQSTNTTCTIPTASELDTIPTASEHKDLKNTKNTIKREESQPPSLTEEEREIIRKAEEKRRSISGQAQGKKSPRKKEEKKKESASERKKRTRALLIKEREKSRAWGIRYTPEEEKEFEERMSRMDN